MPDHSSSCQQQFELLFQQDFSLWQGLESDCRIDQLPSSFEPSTSSFFTSFLGADIIQSAWQTYQTPQLSDPLKIWFEPDSKKILKVEMDWHNSQEEGNQLLMALGEPEAKLDFHYRLISFEGGEYVYPNKGLAICLEPKSRNIYQIVLFPPTKLVHYQARLASFSHGRRGKRRR